MNIYNSDEKNGSQGPFFFRYPKLIGILQFFFGALGGVSAPSGAQNGDFMQKCNVKPANVEIKPAALHEVEKNPVI